jgi:hypothetical protein
MEKACGKYLQNCFTIKRPFHVVIAEPSASALLVKSKILPRLPLLRSESKQAGTNASMTLNPRVIYSSNTDESNWQPFFQRPWLK